MTKAGSFAIWAGWNGIADLNVFVGDYHPHYQPLDELPLLLPRRLLELFLHPAAELVDAQAHTCDFALTVDLRLQLLPLGPKALGLLLQVQTVPAIFLQADNFAQIRLGQSLDLLLHTDLPTLQRVAPGLEILRQPMPTMRPLQRIADGLWMGQQTA